MYLFQHKKVNTASYSQFDFEQHAASALSLRFAQRKISLQETTRFVIQLTSSYKKMARILFGRRMKKDVLLLIQFSILEATNLSKLAHQKVSSY